MTIFKYTWIDLIKSYSVNTFHVRLVCIAIQNLVFLGSPKGKEILYFLYTNNIRNLFDWSDQVTLHILILYIYRITVAAPRSCLVRFLITFCLSRLLLYSFPRVFLVFAKIILTNPALPSAYPLLDAF